jgi:hypothetical protein
MKQILIIFLSFAVSFFAEDRLAFNRDIRPILSDNCFSCHGPDSHGRKADLRLDTREGATTVNDGVRAIVPGDPEASEALARLLTDDPDDKMPPPEHEKHLDAAEIATIRRWIKEGAEYESHWAFIAPTRPEPPKVADKTWHTNPVDRFVYSAVAGKGLKPAASADPVTLVRRLHFDLTGLPPEPEVVDAFVADPSQGAYAKLVDKLLGSPHYGERMTSYWLDLVRFADTQGFHSDDQQNIFPYRDYVIKAFNSNMTFDRFTTEQLAGDMLENATIMQKVASGYNRLNQVTGEGGAQAGEYLVKYQSDRVRTTSEVWLGSTLGCAECHDHKFDPFTTEDFYRFSAIFADLDQVGVYSGNARSTGNYPPMIDVPQTDETEKLAELDQKLAALNAERDKILDTLTAKIKVPKATEWQLLMPKTAKSSGQSTLKILPDGSVLSTGKKTKNQNYTVTVTVEHDKLGALRLEILPHDSFPGFSRGNGNAVITGFEVYAVKGGKDRRLKLASAEASETRGKHWPAGDVIDNNSKSGWAAYKDDGKQKSSRLLVFRLAAAETLTGVDTLKVVLRHEAARDFHNTGRFKLTLADHPGAVMKGEAGDAALAKAITTPAAKRTADQKRRVRAHIAAGNPKEISDVNKHIKAAEDSKAKLQKTSANTMVSRSVKPRMIRILPRGDWLDNSGKEVQPGVPAFLPQPEGVGDRRFTRKDLADWILDDANPLTARVFVNRLWYLFFGNGISNVLNDLGSQGEWPQHPELLDWLAVEFRESGWDIQHVIRLLVTSRAYQTSSKPTTAQLAADPLNRLHARQARHRLQAEFVRDNALAISGLLVRDIGGRSVKPYQPAGYWSDSYKSVGRPHKYVQDHGDQLYRRGIYTFWKRTFLHPSLMAFDAPNREECQARRPISNTPLQALVLLNDPTYVEAARAFAVNAMKEPGSDSARIKWIVRRAVGRAPTSAESAVLTGLLKEKRARYKDGDDAAALGGVGEYAAPDGVDVAELAAWTSVTRTVLNLHETVTRE